MIVLDAEPGAVLPAAITVVIVEAAGIAFAVPSRLVERVTPPLPVTPLPLVPDFVDGLVGLGGAILPQIDLCRRLALPGPDRAGGEIMVMLAAAGDYALRVDHVISLATLEGDTVQGFEVAGAPAGLTLDHASAAMVAGEFPWRGRTVLLLRPERVGLPEPAGRATALMVAGERRGGAIGALVPAAAAVEPLQIFVVARAGPGLYALPVEQVAEVVPAAALTPVPGAPPELLGLMQLRGRPMPVLAPAALAGGGGAGPGAVPGVLMVICAGAGRFALRVDAVIGVQRFALSRIHAGSGAEGRAGYLIDAAERVIGLLDADRLVSPAWRGLLSPAETALAVREAPAPARSLLVVRVGGEWCALEAAAVRRLTGWRPLLPVPAGSGDLAGLVEIGADVLPVVDLRTAMAVPAPIEDNTALVVVSHGAGGWVLVVDRIDRLVTVPERALETVADPAHPLAVAITRIGDRLISLLDLSLLLGRP
ncbi:MAG: chemotaxis protein CheW [Rhodospirillaceae bacterium]